MSDIVRLSPRAAFLGKRMAYSDGITFSEFVSQLIIDYGEGLDFKNDPDLDNLPEPK